MAVSAIFDHALIAALADKISHARKLYGADSAYVIGLFTGIGWILEGVEGGDGTRRTLHDRVLEHESGKHPHPPGGGEAGGGREPLAENTWIRGAVKWFNNDKGYGFISTESNTDVFVHWRDISSWDRSLTQGDEVEFMVTKTAKGFQAINVMKIAREDKEEGRSPGAGHPERPERAAAPAPEAAPAAEAFKVETGEVAGEAEPADESHESQ